ncbi:hypothetical protein ACVRW4_04780 [Streptococcus phocae subsp. phocae]
MKKILFLVIALCMFNYPTTINAQESTENRQNKFILDGVQQDIKDENGHKVNIDDFYEGSSKITINMPYGWSVKVFRQNNPDKLSQKRLVKAPNIWDSNRKICKDGYRLYYPNTKYELLLRKDLTTSEQKTCDTKHTSEFHTEVKKEDLEPIKKGERLTFVFQDDGNWNVGYLIYRDAKTVNEEKQYEAEIKKIEDDLEKQDQENDALAMFKRQQEDESKKTWYQRLGDNIQDHWWNFTDSFK